MKDFYYKVAVVTEAASGIGRALAEKSAALGMKVVLAQNSEGHIVNTASSAGLITSQGLGIYKVSKHGVVTLSKTLACELAAHGSKLKASVLCPEFVNTRIFDAERNRPQALQNSPQEQPTSPEMEAARQWLAQVGLPPAQAAQQPSQ